MKKKNKKNYIFYIVVAMFFLMLLFVGVQKHTYMGFNTDVAMTYNQGWQQIAEDGTLMDVSIPGELIYNKKGELVLQHELPQHIMSGLSICIWVNGQSVKAEIEGEQTLSYGLKDNYIFGKNCGNYWYIIRLPESAKGKLLKITLTSPYNKASYHMDHIYIGTQTSLLFILFEQHGLGLFLALLLMLIGFVLAVVYVIFRKSIGTEDMERTLYLCFFSVLLGLWLFAQSRMAQFFVGNNFALLLIYYMGFMLLPIPMLFFMAQIKGNHMRRPVMFLAYLFVINFVVCSVLQFIDKKDYSETVYFTVALLVIGIIMMIINAFLEHLYYHNVEFKYMAIGIYFLTFFGMIELWSIYFGKSNWIGNYVRYGAICLVFALMFKAARNVVDTVEASKTAAYYERLATVDLMTNCYSRTAYNGDLRKLEEESIRGLCVLLFDLNNLKKINDTYGHLAGDQAIKTCAACIHKVFDRVGKVYRIGGDEFVTIIPRCDENKLLQRIAVFKRLTGEQNKRLTFEFSVACGYAICDLEQDNRVEDIIHRADTSMYEKKQYMKANQKFEI